MDTILKVAEIAPKYTPVDEIVKRINNTTVMSHAFKVAQRDNLTDNEDSQWLEETKTTIAKLLRSPSKYLAELRNILDILTDKKEPETGPETQRTLEKIKKEIEADKTKVNVPAEPAPEQESKPVGPIIEIDKSINLEHREIDQIVVPFMATLRQGTDKAPMNKPLGYARLTSGCALFVNDSFDELKLYEGIAKEIYGTGKQIYESIKRKNGKVESSQFGKWGEFLPESDKPVTLGKIASLLLFLDAEPLRNGYNVDFRIDSDKMKYKESCLEDRYKNETKRTINEIYESLFKEFDK